MLSPDWCYGLEKLIKYTLESCPQGPYIPGGKNLTHLYTKAGLSPWHPGSWNTMQPSAGDTLRVAVCRGLACTWWHGYFSGHVSIYYDITTSL